jgi:hypothetical protein
MELVKIICGYAIAILSAMNVAVSDGAIIKVVWAIIGVFLLVMSIFDTCDYIKSRRGDSDGEE